MAKTTNILDLNNRLTKVEQENVAQNSYTSFKNKPKINSVTLTGNKSLADIGAAAAADLTTLAGDVGDVTNLTTTEKTSAVAAINEVKSGLTNLLKYKTFNNTATDTDNHLYNTDVNCDQYVCVGGCTPYNPNIMIQLSNIEITTTGFIRYRLYDVVNNQVVSDNAAYLVILIFVNRSMISELVINP